MSPDKKEELLAGVMLIFIMILSLLVIAATAGCAHDEVRYASPDLCISKAANAASLIDSKTVVVEQWLRTH